MLWFCGPEPNDNRLIVGEGCENHRISGVPELSGRSCAPININSWSFAFEVLALRPKANEPRLQAKEKFREPNSLGNCRCSWS